MKKTKKLAFTTSTIAIMTPPQLSKAVGGVTYTGCNGFSVCLCNTYPVNSCPCIDTAKCEPSYHICG